MIAKARGFSCSDITDVWMWVPASPTEVFYYLEMTIGFNSKAGDLFGLTIATPEALLASKHKLPLWGRHLLIIDDYKWTKVLQLIGEMLRQCQGDSWEEIAPKIARYLYWEFEDYQEEQ